VIETLRPLPPTVTIFLPGSYGLSTILRRSNCRCMYSICHNLHRLSPQTMANRQCQRFQSRSWSDLGHYVIQGSASGPVSYVATHNRNRDGKVRRWQHLSGCPMQRLYVSGVRAKGTQHVGDWANSNNLRLNHVASTEMVFMPTCCMHVLIYVKRFPPFQE